MSGTIGTNKENSMMDIYQKLKIDKNSSVKNKLSELEMSKHKTIRKLNAVFGDIKRERELQDLLDEIDIEIDRISSSVSNTIYSDTKASYLAESSNATGEVSIDIDDGLSNNVRKATFYTYNNGLCYMGDMQLSSTTLCEYPDGNGFAVFWAAKNYESLSREQYINGEFVSSVLGEGRSVSSADEYRNPEDIYPGAYGLKTCSTDSDELLKSVLW